MKYLSIKSGHFSMIVRILLLFSVNLHAGSLEDKIDSILAHMSLEEKILQLHHEGSFNTAYNSRLNIPGFYMADGPHGVRDGMATSFPVGIAMAATWDPHLIERVGHAMGEEFYAKGKNQALGPCMDITRDPRNGRSPESGGEDPYLCAMITSHLIKGIQTTPVIATAKHFNLVNHQVNRTTNNVVIDERNLMEHYGFNFRTAVQMSGVLSVMNSYNLINGEKAAENNHLLTEILRNTWGFPFYVVSDWGSIWDTEKAILAGCDICMGSDHYQNDLLLLVNGGIVPEEAVNEAVRSVLRTKFLSGLFDYLPDVDPEAVNSVENQQLCLEAAEKSIVLLKNESNILPLNPDSINKIAVIGPSAAVAILDGSGSSYVTPFYSVSPLEALQQRLGSAAILYAKGCDINSTDTNGFQDALDAAAQADVVIFFGGLDATQEGEGFDRVGGSVLLPVGQSALLIQLAAVNENLVAVIESGGICSMAASHAYLKGLFYAFYPGQEGGNALANVLLGEVNPGGKLPVSMPVNDAQLPDWNDDFTDDYLCGYRWYDATGQTPLYPFGYGLSYTTFEMSNLTLGQSRFHAGDSMSVFVDVTNSGNRSGDEVVQLYLSYPDVPVSMPVKQLRAFKRITLTPGESRTVELKLSNESFYYYEVGSQSYTIAPGTYRVMVGNSSNNLPLQQNLEVQIDVLKGDLTPVKIWTVPRYPVVGDSLRVLVSVKNEGLIAYPGGYTMKSSIAVNGSTKLCTAVLDSDLEPGGMQLMEFRPELSEKAWVVAQSGMKAINVVLNPDQIPDEYSFTNNHRNAYVTVKNKPPENLALHKPVWVSSVENSGLEGDKAVDGLMYTRWSSSFHEPETIKVDLGEVKPYNRIRLYWETAYGSQYVLQSSPDDTSWKNIKQVDDGNGDVDEFRVADTARFVRMIGLKRATSWGFSLYEFQIFKDLDSVVLDIRAEDNHKTSSFDILNIWPNPFNPEVNIRFKLNQATTVRLEIYNFLGQKIKTVINRSLNAGEYHYKWNASAFSSGIYLCRLETQSEIWIRKMLLIK